MLSGLSRCAGLLVAAKQDAALKHVEFVAVAPGKALVVMVTEDGTVENRLMETPAGLPVSVLAEASNYLNARLRGRTSVLVGHSGGGNVVWGAAEARAGRVARVIFVDTVPPPDGREISEFEVVDGPKGREANEVVGR